MVNRSKQDSLLWLTLALACTVAWAKPNLMPNSSFEQGEVGWTLWRQHPAESSGAVVETATRWGERAFRVENKGAGGANLYSDPIPAVVGMDYTLSVYARTENAERVRVTLWAEDAEGKVLSYDVPNGANVPVDQPAWARFKAIIRAPEDCASLKAHLVCNGGTVWWEAAMLERSGDASRYRDGPKLGVEGDGAKNLLPNSGLEDGETGWTLWHQLPGRSSGRVDDEVGREASAAFHVVNPGGGGANLFSESVPCEPNTVYTVSVFARIRDGAGVRLTGWGLDASETTLKYGIDGETDLPGRTDGWQRFTHTFTTPADCVLLRAHLICNGGEVWWDDCQVERGDQATGYEPGPAARVWPVERLPEAVAYTRALIREARIRDVLAQTRRLDGYAGTGRSADDEKALREPETLVAEVGDAIHAKYLVPDYRNLDYPLLNDRMDRAEKALSDLWRELGHDPKGLFDEWRPSLDGNVDKARLANEFFIFPCFTRNYFFEDEGNWELLKPFGFRLVSGWWGIGVSPEGELRPEDMDRIIETCAAHGYKCDIAVDGAQAAVARLANTLGETIYLHNPEGEWSPSGNCHSTINIWHPEVRRVAADYLTKAAAYYAEHPGVVSYELTNEPSLTIEKRKHGYTYKPLGVGGYSQQARAAWKQWLEAKYGTVERLNERWRTKHASFTGTDPPADLKPPPPADAKSAVPTGPIHDFQMFRAESHADWFTQCVEAMHKGDPGKAVISQFWGACVDRKESALDLRVMAEQTPWDVYGTHDWPGDQPASLSLYAVSMNRKADRPHWEDEFIWSQWERKGTPEPVMRAAVERNLWRQVAWGKRGLSLFNLESEWLHNAPGNWNNSMLNIEADLEVPRYSVGVIPTLERKVNLFKDALYGTRIVAQDVALLRPTAATLVTAPEHSVRQEAQFLADRLLEQNVVPLMIAEEHLADGTMPESRLLIAPWAINVPEAVQERLAEWVRGGGVLFATGPFGLFDEYGKPTGTLLRAALGDLDWRYDAEAGKWSLAGLGGLKAGVAQRKVDGVDGVDSGMLLGAPFGAGHVYLWPDRLQPSKQTAVLQTALDEVVPVRHVRTDLDKLELIPRASAAGEQFLFVTNLDATGERVGAVTVRGTFEAVVELSCEARPRVPVEHAPGVTIVPLNLPPGGALFLSLGRPRQAAPGE
jgi:hypothetical protein